MYYKDEENIRVYTYSTIIEGAENPVSSSSIAFRQPPDSFVLKLVV
jgi:hypothetical protein